MHVGSPPPPVELRPLLVDFLLELLDPAFFDLVRPELFEVGRQPDLLACPDRPLGRVVLPPFDSVAVVAGELSVRSGQVDKFLS